MHEKCFITFGPGVTFHRNRRSLTAEIVTHSKGGLPCCEALPRGAMGLSAVCDCGIF